MKTQRYGRADHLSIVDLDPLDPADELLTDLDAARAAAVAEAKAAVKAKPKTRASAPAPERVYQHHTGGHMTWAD
jgi:hypothetical protein